jgi:hypothetical protein
MKEGSQMRKFCSATLDPVDNLLLNMADMNIDELTESEQNLLAKEIGVNWRITLGYI